MKTLIGGSDNKLIYRHYATLYFVFCVDSSESELGILDLIQVFVETLDKCFENVCELDLIFHVDKVHNILAEMVMGGMVLETNMNEIVTQIDAQNKLEKSEIKTKNFYLLAKRSFRISFRYRTPGKLNIFEMSGFVTQAEMDQQIQSFEKLLTNVSFFNTAKLAEDTTIGVRSLW
ncbi:hypothetical protein IHE44_0011198 [Lamprotornis superbus]|uniref:AP complex mu/sigma subunit domain-containing protein n=1 Tax=Lamprotornis superbus TaxID=245042 RepID=A0A835TWT5_9PASS|nr:hypothetical protein IHE44_0011198 [Lamprotornis superbus]